jgi:selenocysteine-specific elongation factor
LKLLATEKKPLQNWTPVHVHSAAQHITGHLATLEARSVQPGEAQLVQLVLSEHINVCFGDRVIIRDQSASRTLGGGAVIDPFSPRRGRAKPNRILKLHAMRNPILNDRISDMLRASPEGLNAEQLQANFNLTQFSAEEFGELDSRGLLHSFDSVDSNSSITMDAVIAWHKSHPQDAGITESQLLGQVSFSAAMLKMTIERLTRAQKLSKAGNKLKLASHRVEIAGPEKSLWQKVEPILNKDPFRPPVIHDLARAVNLPPAATEKLLNNCVKLGLIVKPVKNRFFLPVAIQSFKQIAISLAAAGDQGRFTVIEFRDRAEIGRNLSIEILEYLDHIGFTRRLQDYRIIQDKSR